MAAQNSGAEYEIAQTPSTESGVPEIAERQGIADTVQASLADTEGQESIAKTIAVLADIEALKRTVLDWG